MKANKHSATIRGLAAAGRRRNFNGRFGRLFPDLETATYGNNAEEEHANLATLAGLMVSEFDPPKDAPDDEESSQLQALFLRFHNRLAAENATKSFIE